MTFFDNLHKSFNENLKQLTKINDFYYFYVFMKTNMNDFYYFCVFMKTIGFCIVFIADMNSACKNTLVSEYLLNFHRRHNFG